MLHSRQEFFEYRAIVMWVLLEQGIKHYCGEVMHSGMTCLVLSVHKIVFFIWVF